jgi:amidohydrolase
VGTRLDALLSDFPGAELERLVETRRDLHRHPELAYEERRTAGIAAKRLREDGLSPREGVAKTGVTAEVGSGGGLLVRADMDALPVEEASGAPFASQVPGRMHACGHDGHVAIGLAIASRLARRRPAGGVRMLFQPAEEGANGALACVNDGVLDGVSRAVGLHLWTSLPFGMVGVNRGALMAAVDEFTIDVEGRGGHGASPHEAADPILAAARIVEALQSVVSREINPLDAAVVTVGTIHGGTAFNVIPGAVRLTGTARSFTEIAGRALPQKVERIVMGTASACGVQARLDYRRLNGATINDPSVADVVVDVARRIVGEENVDPDARSLGGEDFSEFLNRVPGCFFFVGARKEGPLRPHHSPDFDFDERALAVGVTVMDAVVRELAG